MLHVETSRSSIHQKKILKSDILTILAIHPTLTSVTAVKLKVSFGYVIYTIIRAVDKVGILNAPGATTQYYTGFIHYT